MNSTNKVILGLDLLKFILAILILAGHTQLLVEYPSLFHAREELSSIAVPIFLAISAYFFFRKVFAFLEREKPRPLLIKTVKRLSILFISWYILMLPMTYFNFFSFATWKETIFAILLSCTFNGYWFIKALLFNIVIFYFCRRGKALWFCIALSWFIYLLFSYNYIFHFFTFPYHPYYSFYYNMGYFSIGVLFAKYEKRVVSNQLTLLLAVFWIIFFVVDILYAPVSPLFRILSIPIIFILFYQLSMREGRQYKIMRDMSIILYMVQFVLIWIYDLCCNQFLDTTTFTYQTLQWSVAKFFVVLSVAICISLCILRLENNYKVLKYLH